MRNAMPGVMAEPFSTMMNAYRSAGLYALEHCPLWLLGGEDPVNGLDCSGLVLFMLGAMGFQPFVDTPTTVANVPVARYRRGWRMLAADMRERLYNRPYRDTAFEADPRGYTDVADGPDPALGPMGEYMFAYFHFGPDGAAGKVGADKIDHVAISFAPGLIIESNSGLAAAERVIEVSTGLDASLAGPEISWEKTKTPDKTGVRLVSEEEVMKKSDYSVRYYLNYQLALSNGWFGPCPTR